MSVHQTFIKKAVGKSCETLVKEVALTKEIIKHQPQVITDVRKGDVKVKSDNVAVNRVYVKAYDSGDLSRVGWVVNEGIVNCLKCQVKFGLMNGRHHCRACGNLVCQNCSPHRTLIFDFEGLGPMRICSDCTTANTVGQTLLRKNDTLGVSLDSDRALFELEMNAAVALTDAGGEYQPSDRSTLTEDRLSLLNPVVTNTSIMSGLTDLESSTSSLPNSAIVVPILVSNPIPGFVIKTRQNSAICKDKVFINVLHHECVEDLDLTLFQEPIAATDDIPASTSIVPKIYLGLTVASTVDKEGVVSELYNVVVNSEYFSPSSVNAAVKVTDNVAVQKILRAINKHYHTSIHEEMFIFPKVKTGIKGEFFTELQCVANKESVDTVVTKCRERSDSFVSVSTVNTSKVFSPTLSATSVGHDQRRRTLRGSLLSTVGMNYTDKYGDMASEDSSVVESRVTPTGTALKRPSSFFSTRPNAIENSIRTVHSRLSADMFVCVESQCISAEECARLKEQSVDDTRVLIGWQILVKSSNQDGAEDKIYVITDTSKTLARKTEFCLSTLHEEDIWLKLKRNSQKTGMEFTPLRKVLHVDDSSNSHVNKAMHTGGGSGIAMRG